MACETSREMISLYVYNYNTLAALQLLEYLTYTEVSFFCEKNFAQMFSSLALVGLTIYTQLSVMLLSKPSKSLVFRRRTHILV